MRINQIVRNLVTNAIKFTNFGQIAVNFKLLGILDNGMTNIGIEVIDSGMGIPDKKQHAIFDSFTQADNSITREFGGSGLGLTIAKFMVELMKGNISVESPPLSIGRDIGSLFKFNIHLHVPKGSSIAPIPELNPSTVKFDKSYHILVVDDNEINLMLAKKVLETLGATYETATNGKEAVDLARENTFDLVLMDVQMPVMDGWLATQQLRQNNFRQPIIALSANVYKEHIDKCLAVGMNGHLRKPFSKVDLYTMISQCIAP